MARFRYQYYWHDIDSPRADGWHEWLLTTEPQTYYEVACAATRAAIFRAGGVETPAILHVFVCDEREGVHANGAPKLAHRLEIGITRELIDEVLAANRRDPCPSA